MPLMPGTFGSLVGVGVFLLLKFWLAQVVAIVLITWVGIWAATRTERVMALKDPGIVVVDEVVGMWTSLLFLPFTPVTAVAGFVLFRIMDVFKPYPARQFESLPGGWGIMTDDLMAGIYANLLLRAGRLALGL